MSIFKIGEYFPHPSHRERINRYRDNRKLFLGNHYDVFERVQNRLSASQRQTEVLYISVNFAGIICKKSADFLFGEAPTYSAGKVDDAPEQIAVERLVEDNNLNITNYESSLGNAYRGDSFYKIRYGQEFGGDLSPQLDPFKVIIEAQNAEYVFPETAFGDAKHIGAYHIAYPVPADNNNQDWMLFVESHYAGRIEYRQFRMRANQISTMNEVIEWRIYAEMTDLYREVETGVAVPLVVHIPNYATDETWEGIDDIHEHKPILDEINTRLTRIAEILDKHTDPAIAVPVGTLGEDADGNPTFAVGLNKVFEITGKDDVKPEYITWDGQLQSAFTELDKLVNYLLMNAELPAVALGGGEGSGGTSGNSGLAIKFRMNSLLSKINRKRQYYDKGLKKVLYIAQLLEASRKSKIDYEVTIPKIHFADGLPKDELEQATIMQMRTGSKPTISTKSALMVMDGLTEEQAEAELERIKAEEAVASPSIFQTAPLDNEIGAGYEQSESGEGETTPEGGAVSGNDSEVA